ncbi:hypothetical protein HQN90_20400 [Paenibacillus alba]|uniref:phage baseplate protein n=1 Tax=Paenibacillus alba TaxID=1197127 RepID=UPI0015638D94|nr:hypothetical protein [Paenibacillus alba]NQX68490.1 hypothetical protein [Paenibacillus alba]
MALIKGYYVTVESEDPQFEVEITEEPVEKGVNLTDHVQRKAVSMSISGFILGENADEIRQSLLNSMDSGEIVNYDGRNYFTGLIQNFSPKHDRSTANGFSFSMTLKEVRTAESSYVETLPTPIRAQAAPIISSGTKQTKSKDKKEEDSVQKVTFKAGSPWAT